MWSSGPPEHESLEPDLGGVAEYFGPVWPGVERYAELLRTYGVERGLIGPAEVPRLWSRHILNSAALGPLLPPAGVVADVGSGAGLPGVVLALMRPDLALHLIEPMQRRVAWLNHVVEQVGLGNVTVHQGHAQELVGRVTADVVTARAVAGLERLVPWTAPLVAPRGRLLFLKGRRALEELVACEPWLPSLGAVSWQVLEAGTGDLGDSTSVVEIVFGGGVGPAQKTRTGKAEPRRTRSRSRDTGGGTAPPGRAARRGSSGA